MIQIATDKIRLNNAVHRGPEGVDKVLFTGARAVVNIYIGEYSEPAVIETPLSADESELLSTLILAIENRVRDSIRERL